MARVHMWILATCVIAISLAIQSVPSVDGAGATPVYFVAASHDLDFNDTEIPEAQQVKIGKVMNDAMTAIERNGQFVFEECVDFDACDMLIVWCVGCTDAQSVRDMDTANNRHLVVLSVVETDGSGSFERTTKDMTNSLIREIGIVLSERYPNTPSKTFVKTTIEGRITNIIDGDTFDMRVEWKNDVQTTPYDERIRLAIVNTPESDERGYKEGTDATKWFCKSESWVKVDVDPSQKRTHDRLVGHVYCNNKSLNAMLIDTGNAHVFKKFCKGTAFAHYPWAVDGCTRNVNATLWHAEPKALTTESVNALETKRDYKRLPVNTSGATELVPEAEKPAETNIYCPIRIDVLGWEMDTTNLPWC